MISKPKEPVVIGVNKDIPEGIFGKVEVPEDSSTQAQKKRKFIQIGEHRVELTDMVHIDFDLKKKGKSKKRVKTLGKPKRKSVTLDKKKNKTAGRKKRDSVVMPSLAINYESTMPPQAEGLELENVVSIPEEVLQRVVKKTEKRTKRLSKMMLNSVTPSMLSYDAASNYVQAVLSDGLKIDVEVDRGVLEVVKEMSRLDVIFFYMKRMKLPKSLKEKFMHTFIEEMAKSSLEGMKKADKSESFSSQLREMEAVIMKRSERQTRDNKVRKSATPEREGAGAQRSRRDNVGNGAPLMGGF
jgi:hypothetical protein